MSISERLREARENSGLSQAQVAKKLEMHRPTITEIEAGRRKVSAQEIEKFARLYDVSIEWLVNGTVNNEDDEKILLAARELSKMTEKDLERLMKTLQILRNSGKSDDK